MIETNTDRSIQIKCDEKIRCFGERVLEGSYRPMLRWRGVEGICGGGEDDFHKERNKQRYPYNKFTIIVNRVSILKYILNYLTE